MLRYVHIKNTTILHYIYIYIFIYFYATLIGYKPKVNITHSNNKFFVKDIREDFFEVHEGREFQILCFSYGTYRGNVTWRKLDTRTIGK